MNTNRARAQLDAVQHQIVRFRAAARRIRRQLLQILVVHRSERMMRGLPAARLLRPIRTSGSRPPRGIRSSSGRAACAGRYTSARRTAAVVRRPGRPSLRDGGPSARRPSRPEQQQIVFGRAGPLAHLGHRFREVAIQPLRIVENTQPALGPERFQLIALLAAQRAGLRDVDRHQRQPCGREISPGTDPPPHAYGGMRRSGLSLP